MAYNSATLLDVYNRLVPWIDDQDNAGDYVSDVALDLLSRARQVLWGKAFWCDLMVFLELSGAYALSNKAVNLPTNYGKTKCVYHDSDSDGKPDWYYFEEGDYGEGYRKTCVFTESGASAGKVYTISFFKDPLHTPTIVYQKILSNFSANSKNLQALFFPEELLLKQAQLLHMDDSHEAGSSAYVNVKQEFESEFMEFQRHAQFNNPDYDMKLNDANGNRIYNEAYDLDGGGEGAVHRFDNSYDDGVS